MKKFILDFIRRGLFACGFGPLALAVIYLILQHQGVAETLTLQQAACGIFSISALAFVAGGMNAVYQVERLPLMMAILIHGSVLYVCYLATYLLNNWLEKGVVSILVFTGIFLLGYLMIWLLIYFVIRHKTVELNEMLQKKQQTGESIPGQSL